MKLENELKQAEKAEEALVQQLEKLRAQKHTVHKKLQDTMFAQREKLDSIEENMKSRQSKCTKTVETMERLSIFVQRVFRPQKEKIGSSLNPSEASELLEKLFLYLVFVESEMESCGEKTEETYHNSQESTEIEILKTSWEKMYKQVEEISVAAISKVVNDKQILSKIMGLKDKILKKQFPPASL